MSFRYPSHSPPDPSTIHHTVIVNPRPLAPLQEPPSPHFLPQLPSPIRDPSFSSSYTLTTHLYPSAYPHAPSAPLPQSAYADIPGETKAARVARKKALLHELWMRNVSRDNSAGRREADPKVFWNVVNRFARKNLGGEHEKRGLTLFIAHANGFHKEIWEPFLQELLPQSEVEGVMIDEAWVFEAVQHGDSALINDKIIGDVFDWADNARDILNFLFYHLPELPSTTSLPTHLPRLSDVVATRRYATGYLNRSLVGIGHSFGGGSIARAALGYPALFSSIVFVEPVIRPVWTYPPTVTEPPPLASLAIQRRTSWSSQDDALATLQTSPFFRAWHPAVLWNHVQYGMCPDPNSTTQGAVRLKMSGVQEAIVFIDNQSTYETWEMLPNLDSRIELYYILSGKDSSAAGGDRATRELVWRRSGNTSNVVIPSAGHLIPQEVPQELAILVVEFLRRKYSYSALKSQQRTML